MVIRMRGEEEVQQGSLLIYKKENNTEIRIRIGRKGNQREDRRSDLISLN